MFLTIALFINILSITDKIHLFKTSCHFLHYGIQVLDLFLILHAHVKYQILLHYLFPILKFSRINLGFNRHPNRHLNHHLHRHHHLPPTKGDKNIQSIYKEHINDVFCYWYSIYLKRHCLETFLF